MTWTRQEELAWAGGFFEGEGCFFGHNQPPRKDGTAMFRVRASVTQNDKSLLIMFQRIVGCGNVRGPDNRGGSHWRGDKNEDAHILFSLLGKYLGLRRCEAYHNLVKKEKEQNWRWGKLKEGALR